MNTEDIRAANDTIGKLVLSAPPEIRALLSMLLYAPGECEVQMATEPCAFAFGRWWVEFGVLRISTIHPPEHHQRKPTAADQF